MISILLYLHKRVNTLHSGLQSIVCSGSELFKAFSGRQLRRSGSIACYVRGRVHMSILHIAAIDSHQFNRQTEQSEE